MGFWAVQRIQDDLIRITQQSRDPLFVAFMSISETHNRVNRQILREILHKSLASRTHISCMLRALYGDIAAV